MKDYYIHSENGQIGPLTFEQLKQHSIKRETLVWFEGMEDWRKAGSIEELVPFFKSIPPPLSTNNFHTSPPPIPITPNTNHETQEPLKIFGIRKNFLFYGIFGLAFIICISAFSSYNSKAEHEKEEKDKQLELYNSELVEQKAAIDEQNKRIAEQERLEKERIEREKRIAIENRIKEISSQLTTAYQNLENAKRHLDDATAFKLLRSSSERHNQISEAETVVTSWQNEITNLETEMKNLNPAWVKY